MEAQQYEALLKRFDILEEKLAPLERILNTSLNDDAFTSSDIAALYEAFAKAQGEYPNIQANRDNPYYKRLYEDLHLLMRAIRPILAKYGLSFSQVVQTLDSGESWLVSRLQHESGQWMQSRVKILTTKNDFQFFGSALQYTKRFAAMSLLGLTIEYDMDDDDAEMAMQEHRDMKTRGTKTNAAYSKKGTTYETVTKEQLEELEYELGEYTDIYEDMLEALKIQSLADMPKDKWSWSLRRIREIKQAREQR